MHDMLEDELRRVLTDVADALPADVDLAAAARRRRRRRVTTRGAVAVVSVAMLTSGLVAARSWHEPNHTTTAPANEVVSPGKSFSVVLDATHSLTVGGLGQDWVQLSGTGGVLQVLSGPADSTETTDSQPLKPLPAGVTMSQFIVPPASADQAPNTPILVAVTELNSKDAVFASAFNAPTASLGNRTVHIMSTSQMDAQHASDSTGGAAWTSGDYNIMMSWKHVPLATVQSAVGASQVVAR